MKNMNRDPRVGQLVVASGFALVNLINSMQDAGDKCSSAMAMSFNSIASLAAMLMKEFDARNGKLPTPDHNLLALFLIYEGCSMTSSGEAFIEFSTLRMKDAMDSFERFTGRKADDLIDSNLLAAVQSETKIKGDFGNNNRFLPQ